MGWFRVGLILFGVAIATCGVLFLFTRERRFLRWAGRLFLAGIVTALVFFGVLLVERLVA